MVSFEIIVKHVRALYVPWMSLDEVGAVGELGELGEP